MNRDNISIRYVEWATHSDALMKVRTKVFIEEQNVPPEIERDEWDALSFHVLVEKEGKPIATGRLLPDGHIGRVAVVKEYRGEGIGTRIMDVLCEYAVETGKEYVELSSQVHAVPFYEKCGFECFGEEYEEAGIEHIAMRKKL